MRLSSPGDEEDVLLEQRLQPPRVRSRRVRRDAYGHLPGWTRLEFDELKRRLCAVMDLHRASVAMAVLAPFPAVGAVFALPATVLRDWASWGRCSPWSS